MNNPQDLISRADAIEAVRYASLRHEGKSANEQCEAALHSLPSTPSDEVERLRAENNTLRGIVAAAGLDCPYCGLPSEDLAKCKSGFPGCARMDDIILAPNLPGSPLPWRREVDEDTTLTRIYAADGSLVMEIGRVDQPIEQQESDVALVLRASALATPTKDTEE